MKTIIVAYDKKYGIGAKNDLLWQRDLPTDMAHFKEATTGGAVIMGMHTYTSMGRPLPGRQNIVISRSAESIPGVIVVNSLEAAYAAVEADRETYVIGGGQIYALALDSVDAINATEVDAVFEQADTFFTPIDLSIWNEVSREHHKKNNKDHYDFDFVNYVRR